MTLRQKQSRFVHMVALLILHAEQLGYEVTLGDAWSSSWYRWAWDALKRWSGNKLFFKRLKYLQNRLHTKGSYHFKRLAIDLNLFRNGKYLRSTKAHKPLGEYWESIGGSWGGRWGDGNHYSYDESKGGKK